jgi:hypothetical protein
MAKFERRFAGKDNAGLRAEIRRVVKFSREQGNDVARAVESIASLVAVAA